MNWDLPKQKYLVGNAEGIAGDCWRCCVAAIMQIPAENVPHFLQLEIDGGGNMDCSTQEFVNGLGWFMAEAPRLIFWRRSNLIDIPVISSGPTERSRGMGKHHAIVTINDQVVYDPHPSNAGLTAITSQTIIAPFHPPWQKT